MASAAQQYPSEPNAGLGSTLGIRLVIIFGIFATTLPQPQVLGKLPLQHVLKDTLHVSRGDMATFFFLCGIAWYFKPFAGILTDAFPIFGTKRRHYILISSVLACLSWLAIPFLPKTYTALLYGSIVVNVFMVMASTATGAFLVQAGQALGATGRLTSLRIFVQNFCTLIQGPLGGFLALSGLMMTAGVNAFFMVSAVPIVYFFLTEKPTISNSDAFSNAGRQLATLFTSPIFLGTIVFLGLFYFSPGFATPLFYRQTDQLKFSLPFIGLLGSISGACAMSAAVLYGFLIKRCQLRTMILLGVASAAAGTLFYLFYNNWKVAIFIEAQNGFFFTLAEIALLDLAARAVPKGAEGLGYSLMLSIRNVALFGADVVASKFADKYHLAFSTLVFVNAGTTAFVLIFIPFLPRILVGGRDTTGPQLHVAEAQEHRGGDEPR